MDLGGLLQLPCETLHATSAAVYVRGVPADAWPALRLNVTATDRVGGVSAALVNAGGSAADVSLTGALRGRRVEYGNRIVA